ncbi:uncharacterized protein LY89DRAFT_677975 [Mollisia scopiformis]|uniref:Uncharacterized protein n=1 Tax=Mollisia scopiformis TaxID=149040 RepID=A0A132B540_MOLSC|nr:uncharacterized protein LY89DRAFT_677975 [Mollisia scopiformis]KUJ07363.1 hypothetical protein LY89DRAFT_677975 [Mollisia scopiformis]
MYDLPMPYQDLYPRCCSCNATTNDARRDEQHQNFQDPALCHHQSSQLYETTTTASSLRSKMKMSASADSSSKSWYDRLLARLRQEAPAVDQTLPLGHLPVETLTELIVTTFKSYETRSIAYAKECLHEGDEKAFVDFIKAHHRIIEQFQLQSPHYYRDMARTLNNHFIRKTQDETGTINSTIEEACVPRIPDCPLSGPPTPDTISS